MRKFCVMILLCALLLGLSCPVQAVQSGSCGESVFWSFENGVLTLSGTGAMKNYTAASQIPWYGFRNEITSVVVEEGITGIGNLSFAQCSALTSVSFPGSLERIGQNAFWGCRALENAVLPEGLTELGSGAFFQCISLTQISVPTGVTVLKQAVFAQCEKLDTAALHDGIVEIGKDAFSRCYALKHITLPVELERIETHAFFGCAQLQQLTFPQTVARIGEAAFYGCVNLKSLRFMGSAPSLHEKAFLDIEAAVCYSMHDRSWDEAIKSSYGGSVTWTQECFHAYTVSFTPPGCLTEGYSTYDCSLCGNRYNDLYIPALGHTPGDAVKENEGAHGSHEKVVYCSVCGEELSREYVDGYVPGDITGDGEVNNKDLTRLFRYLSGYEVEVQEAALDVNGDGLVSNKDLTRLFRHLSGYEVEIH